MRLDRLEISGFKSFSDRSELAFDKGVTAIVGPNGCGKSNVADAITWVLGEQSAKSLRGDKMEDVIFSGSDARKAGGTAEVRLKLSGLARARQALEDDAGLVTVGAPEFGGPAGNWSPETLFVAAVADWFVLSCRAIATASRLEWLEIDCGAEGVLEKTDTGMRFTAINIEAHLRVPPGADVARAERLLEKSEKACLVSNSLNFQVHLQCRVSS